MYEAKTLKVKIYTGFTSVDFMGLFNTKNMENILFGFNYSEYSVFVEIALPLGLLCARAT